MCDAKTYLQQVKLFDMKIDRKNEELDWLNALARKITTTLKADVVSSSGSQDQLGDIVSKIVDLKTEINRDIDELISKRNEIKRVIERLSDSDQYMVLDLLYCGVWDNEKEIRFYPTWKYIADMMHMTERNAQIIHGNALRSISSVLNEGKQ